MSGIGQSLGAPAAGLLDNRVGDTIDYDVEVSLTTDDCPISDGTVSLTLPNGTIQVLKTGVSLAPGGVLDFDETTLGLPDYVISAADLNAMDEVTATAVTTATATESTNPVITQPVTATTPYSLQVARPETTLTKSASPTSGRSPLLVTYTFDEKNVSPDTDPTAEMRDAITGSSIVITDSDVGCTPTPTLSGGFNVGDTNHNGLLDVGETWVYTCTETLINASTSPVVHTDSATATGTAEDGLQAGTPTSQGAPATEDSNAVAVTVTNPETSLAETASSSLVRTGTLVTFTYKETNTGSDKLSGVTVTGSFCGAATFTTSSNGDTTTLDPGATWTFTCSKVVTNSSSSVVTVTDNATVTGTDVVDGLPGPAETATASVKVINPATNLVETASAASVPVGTPVTFTYKETNTGSDKLSGVTVTGSFCGAATLVSSTDGVKTVLDPLATWTFTCTKAITVAVTDTATATGTDTVDGLPAPPETAQASVTVTHVSTTLTETASAKKVASGTSVTFTYNETNHPGSDPITGVTVTGSLCGPATFVKSSDGNTTVLEPGATWTFTCTTTVTNTGKTTITVTDKATATGTDMATGKVAPPELAQVKLKITPAKGCGLSVTVSPNPLVETGSSQVDAVVQVEACPSFAGTTVTIGSQQLGLSCSAITFGSLQPGVVTGIDSIQVVLDDDGNVTVSLTGSNCAPGSNLIEVDLVNSRTSRPPPRW